MDDQHNIAQELSLRAARLLAQGESEEAKRVFAEAAKHELEALAAVPPDKIKTRSVLSVSVASLLYKGGLLNEAELAIFRYLAEGDIDPWAEGQLRELLQVVMDERVLVSTLSRRYSGESITVSLRGGEIGAGTGPLDLILDKAVGFRSLLYRMAEWVGQFPLRQHGPPPRELQDLVYARAMEPAPGSYRLEIRLTEPVQPDLYQQTKVPPSLLSDSLFSFLERLTVGTPKDLEEFVPQPEYRRALLQLTRNVAPGGKRVKELGIYRQKDNVLQSVYLTDALPPKIRDVLPKRPESTAERNLTIQGILRALHLDRNWLELTLEDRSHITCDTVPEMLDDVVGPMVNRKVLVSGQMRQKRGKDRLLVSEIELVDQE